MSIASNSGHIAEETKADLLKRFDGRMVADRPLADLVTFGIGGKAVLYAEVSTAEELAEIVAAADDVGIPFFMLGGGSNVLVSENGYGGLVIHNSIKGMTANDTNIEAGAGIDLQDMVDFATEKELSGLEFAAGIYGTVGGAIFGNAGAYGSETGAILKSAELVDRKGRIRTEPAEYFDFGYRSSILKRTGEFVTRAKFALKMGKKELIRKRVDEILAHRARKLPQNARTAGCFFKNIPDVKEEFGKLAAGKLLDEIGAKTMRFGDARVFEKHANIIINDGKASAEDVRRLAEILKAKVKEKFGIELQEEITYLGEF
ncbi:MAG: UDP-N-acetylmuramate dehydrogenase [candidate division Zixibacteria bacterium]|nr:UDP-N-acetylmuramate dehydrogenase [candidate division Zixibacteria bacterium]